MKQLVLLLSLSFLTVCGFAQWTDQNSGVSNDFNDVHFIDNNTGWIAGRQGKILHTTDGGANWELQNSGTTEDLNKIHMVNASSGYAVGDNGAFVKYDGSAWSSIDINFSQDMHGVYFIDASTGWISGDWGRIMKTIDGGNSWNTQMDNSTFSNLFYDLHMISATEGWAVGTSGKVLKYDGSSWSGQSTPAGDDLFAVHFSSSSNGFMVGDQSKVYHYDGSGWSEHSTSLSSSSYDVEDVHVIDGSTAYASTAVSGGAGIILKYDGTSWSTDYENDDFLKTELFYGIHFPSAGKGYTVGPGGLIKTMGTPTGIAITGDHTEVSPEIYPNPSNGEFFMRNAQGKIEVYNATGKRVLESYLQQDEINKIDLTSCGKGIYWIKMSNEETHIRRVVVQ